MTSFTETGLCTDVMNAWTPNPVYSSMDLFNRLKPVKRYEEYFKEQGLKFEARGHFGLFSTVMQMSNPEAVSAFDRLVDEFNSDLPRIEADRDNTAVQEFLSRAQKLRNKLPGIV